MYTIILTAPSLCLFTIQPTIVEEIDFNSKPSPRDVDILSRKFALKHNVELDSIQIDIREKERLS